MDYMTFEEFLETDLEQPNTCKSSCDPGFTTNGATEDIFNAETGLTTTELSYKCSACNPMCATCEDNSEVGDKDKCLTCAPTHPFIHSATSTCYEECGIGLYAV